MIHKGVERNISLCDGKNRLDVQLRFDVRGIAVLEVAIVADDVLCAAQRQPLVVPQPHRSA